MDFRPIKKNISICTTMSVGYSSRTRGRELLVVLDSIILYLLYVIFNKINTFVSIIFCLYVCLYINVCLCVFEFLMDFVRLGTILYIYIYVCYRGHSVRSLFISFTL